MKKMNGKIAKFIIALIMIITIFLAYENQECFAADEELSISGILDKGSSFIDQGQAQSNVTENSLIDDFLPIGRVLVAIATATVVIVMAIMGIRWITATPEQQATLKKQLIGLVVSIVVIYGAVGIWSLVKSIMENMTNN